MGRSPTLCHTPTIRPPLTRSSEVKGGPLHHSHRLYASPACTPTTYYPTPFHWSGLSSLISPVITHISPRHAAVWLMRPLLIMASGTGVSALSLDTIRPVLSQRTPKADTRVPQCADMAQDNEALQWRALIYLAELIHPSHVLKFRELPQITWTYPCQGDICTSCAGIEAALTQIIVYGFYLTYLFGLYSRRDGGEINANIYMSMHTTCEAFFLLIFNIQKTIMPKQTLS